MTRTERALTGDAGGGRGERALLAGAILVLGALLFGPTLAGGPGHVDELRYAEVTRQMTEYGHLLVPHINGEVYSEKPPMFFWLSGLAYGITGDRIAAARLVAALAVILTALLLVPLARWLFRSRLPGWLGAAIFLTSAMAISRGQLGVIDSLLVVFTTAATVALLFAAEARGRRRAGLAALAAAAIAAGILTKGPVGLLCPLIGVVATGAVARGRRGVPVVATLVASAAAAAVALGWLALAGREAGWGYFDQMLFAQSADRVAEGAAHAKPPTWYLVSVLTHFLPWTLLLPGAAWLAVRRRRATESARGALAALAFAGAGIFVFSLFSAKRSGYVFPFYPPLALAVGWGVWRYGPVDRFFRPRAADRGPFWALAVLAVAAGAALALLPALAPVAPKIAGERNAAEAARLSDSLGLATGAVAVASGLAAIALGVAAIRAIRTERLRRFAFLVAAAAGALVGGAGVAALPSFDPGRDANEFGAFLVRIEDPARPFLLLGGHLDGRVNFYTGARRYDTTEPGELADAIAAAPADYVVTRDRTWNRVPEEVRGRFEEVGADRPGEREWRVYRLRR